MVHERATQHAALDGSGNATYWGTEMPRDHRPTPAVGAVAWWRAGVYPAGSAGHVAYVERVIPPTEIIVSQDSWGGDFSWARITLHLAGLAERVHPLHRPKPAPDEQNVRSAPSVSGDLKVG